MKKFAFIGIFIALISLPLDMASQCAMCKAVVESGEKELIEGVNNGILYMMGVPYILMVIVGLVWYKKFLKPAQDKEI